MWQQLLQVAGSNRGQWNKNCKISPRSWGKRLFVYGHIKIYMSIFFILYGFLLCDCFYQVTLIIQFCINEKDWQKGTMGKGQMCVFIAACLSHVFCHWRLVSIRSLERDSLEMSTHTDKYTHLVRHFSQARSTVSTSDRKRAENRTEDGLWNICEIRCSRKT